MIQANNRSYRGRWNKLLLTLFVPLALVSCSDNDSEQQNLDQLDEQLTQTDGDPAVEGSMDEQILIDPELAGGSGDYKSGDGSAVDLSGTKLMSAGKPVSMSEEELDIDCEGDGKCNEALEQDLAWAGRMPKAFTVFPNARLQGAAGIDNGDCNIRGARFVTANDLSEVVDYYYTRAKKAGYTAEYIQQGNVRALGGTRKKDDTAYLITFTKANDGTTVDIVASKS